MGLYSITVKYYKEVDLTSSASQRTLRLTGIGCVTRPSNSTNLENTMVREPKYKLWQMVNVETFNFISVGRVIGQTIHISMTETKYRYVVMVDGKEYEAWEIDLDKVN
jgi:hypothetical protein